MGKNFNKASDAYIKQARLTNLEEIKKRNKKLVNKGRTSLGSSFYNFN
jgi:hypothetical protein